MGWVRGGPELGFLRWPQDRATGGILVVTAGQSEKKDKIYGVAGQAKTRSNEKRTTGGATKS